MDSVVRTSDQRRAAAVQARPSLRDVLRVWTRVSIAGIGGPALQITTMHRLAVQKRRWISEDRFFHALSYCIALPGPETQQLAIYIGWLSHRMIGGIIAGGLFILPGVICMMALCFGFVTGADSQFGQAIFLGVKPAILAIMTEAILRFGRAVLLTRPMVAIAALAFVAAFFKVAFPIIVFVAAALGLCAVLAGLPVFERAAPATAESLPVAFHDEMLPDHTQPTTARFLRSLITWLAIWLAPVILLLAILGPASVYNQISLLFSKVALMAIGGDYAVIAYAAQQVVDSYHWVSAREMQEGIALGEMVPGTIMIVTQFLGFLTAYRQPGLLPPLIAGTVGGLLATWMTFAPCFLWIFVIAPFIEGLRDNAFLNGPLRAVTAAAVGMIVNLSVWFGIHTLFRDVDPVHLGWLTFDLPNFASLDLWALALFALAAVAVLRFRVSAVVTLLTSSALGLFLLYVGLAGMRSY
jgi:chromate transporter